MCSSVNLKSQFIAITGILTLELSWTGRPVEPSLQAALDWLYSRVLHDMGLGQMQVQVWGVGWGVEERRTKRQACLRSEDNFRVYLRFSGFQADLFTCRVAVPVLKSSLETNGLHTALDLACSGYPWCCSLPGF